MNIGQRLRHERGRAGLTQKELAERARVDEKTVRSIEAGRSARPHLGTLRALEGALDAPDALVSVAPVPAARERVVRERARAVLDALPLERVEALLLVLGDEPSRRP